MIDSTSIPPSSPLMCANMKRLSNGDGVSNGDDFIKKRDKRVRFSSHVATRQIPSPDDDCENESNTTNSQAHNTNGGSPQSIIWWTPDEMTEFRHAAKVSSREVSRNVWMMDSFEEAHRIARQLAAASHDDESAYNDIFENPALHISQELVSWCRYGHSRRGLERWSSKFHNAARTESVKRARRKVLEEIKEEVDPEIVRRTYERLTRSSRIFARFLGHADESALAQVVSESQKKSSSNKLDCCEPASHIAPSSPRTTAAPHDGKIVCRLRINRQ